MKDQSALVGEIRSYLEDPELPLYLDEVWYLVMELSGPLFEAMRARLAREHDMHPCPGCDGVGNTSVWDCHVCDAAGFGSEAQVQQWCKKLDDEFQDSDEPHYQ